jgi:hypothetical protein
VNPDSSGHGFRAEYAVLRGESSGEGPIEVTDEGIVLRGRVIVRAEDIACAYIAPPDDAVRVVGARGLLCTAWLPNDAHAGPGARAMAQAIGRIPRRGRVVLPIKRAPFLAGYAVVLSGLFAGAIVFLSLVLTFPDLAWHATEATWCLGLAVGLALMFSYGRLEVGTDGLLVGGWMASRFIPYAELEEALSQQGRIILRMRSEKRRRLCLLILDGLDEKQVCEAIVARIEEARLACVRGASDTSAAALVGPRGRTARQWMEEVRKFLAVPGYREQAVDAERLWRVVEDPATDRAARAGAAMALSESDEWRPRLRVAASDCADPQLRVALVRIAEGASDDGTEEAVAPLLGREE